MGAPLNPDYTEYHPKWYRPRMPIFWWLGKRPYTKFIARELTSVFVAYSAVLLLLQLWFLSRGPEEYGRFVAWLQLRPVIALHVVVLIALLFHTVTWLNLAPKALVLRLGGRRVPPTVVLLMHYAVWVVASGAVAFLLLVS